MNRQTGESDPVEGERGGVVGHRERKERRREGRKERKAATARLSVTVWAHPPHRNSQK